MNHKILLLDWDGVLYRGEYFSDIYCAEFGADNTKVVEFMNGPKVQTNVNKLDLKEELQKVLTEWKWTGNVDELLEYWLKSDCEVTEETIEFVKNAKSKGLKVYVATDQEKYKADYIWKVIGAKNFLDGKFISCEMGLLKTDPNFFKEVIKTLGVLPEEILYLDDSQSKVDAAKKIGIDARLVTSFESMKSELNAIN